MLRFAAPRATLQILTALLILGGLAGLYQASAEEDAALPQLNDAVLVSPQAVVAADFYVISRSRLCTDATPCNGATQVPNMSVFCNTGDEVVGSFAWRQDAAGVPIVALRIKPIGAEPLTGVLAITDWLGTDHRSFLRVVCANTA